MAEHIGAETLFRLALALACTVGFSCWYFGAREKDLREENRALKKALDAKMQKLI